MGDDNNDTERGRDPAEGARDTVDEAIAEHTSDEPRVVAPGPMNTAPSSTGVVAGDPSELEEAPPPPG